MTCNCKLIGGEECHGGDDCVVTERIESSHSSGCSTVEVRNISDEKIQGWAKRHDLEMCGSLTDLRCMVEDAQSLHLIKP